MVHGVSRHCARHSRIYDREKYGAKQAFDERPCARPFHSYHATITLCDFNSAVKDPWPVWHLWLSE